MPMPKVKLKLVNKTNQQLIYNAYDEFLKQE